MKYPQETGQALSVQFGFRRRLCSNVIREKQSEENLVLGQASPRAPWWRPKGVTGTRPAGGGADTGARVRGSLATWLPPALDLLASHSVSFLHVVYLIFTLDSASERAGWTAQMSHSLSLDVMEMADVAALLDKLAAGLAATPNTSGVPSPSARSARPEPCDRTCCWSLRGRKGTRVTVRNVATRNPFFLPVGLPLAP